MTVTKIVMPMEHEDNTDKWGIVGSNQVETPSDDSSEGPYEDNSSIEYGDSLGVDA
jgi:hypothetical protein